MVLIHTAAFLINFVTNMTCKGRNPAAVLVKVLHNIAEELCVADSRCPYFHLSFLSGVCLAWKEEAWKAYVHIYTSG